MLQPPTPPPMPTALAVFGRSMGADCILCVPVKRWLLFSTLVTLGTAACASGAKDLKPSLEATDSGKIWFASAGSLPRSPDGSRFVPGDPVVLSGELGFPAGNRPFPPLVIPHGSGATPPPDPACAH